ncbi:MAG: glycosyl hydrolase 108 family protein [Candidatus Contendobacter sp.]|nr:glycosyl hydrolase 108 family protein [Candidatus Contendobacter sp.]MDG4558857.1 glycosyl hydrolase 108 family protein [Candidatus Contendobacter sp.]
MGDFHRCIEIILIEEGGLVNHPRDPGKLTKFGISQRSYPDIDITALTREQAIGIYQRDYWEPIHGGSLPVGLDLLLLDTAANMGATTAVLLLQEAVGVTMDGIIGPVTLARARQTMPDVLREFCALRAWHYEINRNEDVFGKGWFRRLFHMYDTAVSWHVGRSE